MGHPPLLAGLYAPDGRYMLCDVYRAKDDPREVVSVVGAYEAVFVEDAEGNLRGILAQEGVVFRMERASMLWREVGYEACIDQERLREMVDGRPVAPPEVKASSTR